MYYGKKLIPPNNDSQKCLSEKYSVKKLNLFLSSMEHKQRCLCSNQIKSNQIKSNQITFIVTSPQHKCLGEWNSYERAPDSAKKNKKQNTIIYIWTVHIYRLYRRQCAKYTYIYSVHIVYYKDILSYQNTNALYTVCTCLHYVHIYA